MLLAFALTASIFRDVNGKFGVESLAVSPYELRQSATGDELIVDYLRSYYATVDSPGENWRKKFLDQPLTDSTNLSESAKPAKTSAEIDPKREFVPCREFRCVASSNRGAFGRTHWVHISNRNRVERKYKDIPHEIVVPIVVSETSEPINILVSSDLGVHLMLRQAPGARVLRLITEEPRLNFGNSNLTSHIVTEDGQWIRNIGVNDFMNPRFAVGHINQSAGRPRGLDSSKYIPDGLPAAPSRGPDQIVDIEDVIRKTACRDRIVYIGEDDSFKFEPTAFRGGSVITATWLKEQLKNQNHLDPCDRPSAKRRNSS
jgi:hypothetical protein